jgi:hypothetical protein
MRRLEQALLSLPIYADHLKFLRFRWKSLLYELSIVLLFGLASSPRVFTNLVKPIAGLNCRADCATDNPFCLIS